MLHVDEPAKRVRETVEFVIEFGDQPMDLKGFSWAYKQIIKQAEADGVDLSYDDALVVIAHDGELVFSYTKKS